jgi:N-acetylglucosamine kinase-like BadF-type ATPase
VTEPALAVDAGQTQTRATRVRAPGPALSTGPGVPRLGGGAGVDDIAAPVLRAIGGLDEVPEAPVVGVGLSGIESMTPEHLGELAATLARELGATRVVIASDGVTSYLGALGSRAGAVVAAGTGTVVVARNGDRWAQVDGWGSLLGDAGSGFAIGRAGLDAALRDFDGRGEAAALREAAERRFGRLARLPHTMHGSESPTRKIASFAPEVARIAAAGDRAAAEIIVAAGAELAASAAAALGRVLPPEAPAAVACVGSVFEAGTALRDPFARELVRRRPSAELVEPAGNGLAGAAELTHGANGLPPEAHLVFERS